jgi:uncharacterized protein YqeY
MSADTVRATLRKALTVAMKARDAFAVAALRTAIAAIDNAESIDTTGLTDTEVPRRVLTPAEVQNILAEQVQEYVTEAEGYEAVAQEAAAQQLRRQAEVVRRYLSAKET